MARSCIKVIDLSQFWVLPRIKTEAVRDTDRLSGPLLINESSRMMIRDIVQEGMLAQGIGETRQERDQNDGRTVARAGWVYCLNINCATRMSFPVGNVNVSVSRVR